MGRQRKTETELLPPENEAQKPALKTVEAKHTIVYNEPVRIPVEPEPDEADELELAEPEVEDDEAEQKPRPLSPRARLREKLAKLGVGSQSLKLRIDRLPNYEINGQSGINAEKDYIRTTQCTDAFFESDDYLEHIRSVGGPGTYWLTLRGGKSVIAQWQERIGGAPQAPASAENPTVEAYQPAPQSDALDSLLKQAKKFTELRKLLAPEADNQPRTVANGDAPTTEQALLTLMNADNAVVDAVAGKLRGLFRGNGGGAVEPERSWLDVLYIAIERDTLPKLINQFATQFKPVASNAATGDAPAQQPQPVEQQMTPDVAAYHRLIQVLINAMRVNSDPLPVIRAADGFIELFPEHEPMLQGFLNAPVEMLLPALAQTSPMAAEVVAMPHAAEWIGKLKAAYFEEGEELKSEEN